MANKRTSRFGSNLRKGIISCFAIDDIKILCADLAIDYQNLGGNGKEV
jgi:hypothetical protein